MTSCAATTTIREALEKQRREIETLTDGMPEETAAKYLERNDGLLAALAFLEQLVEAAQEVVETVPYGGRTEYEALAAALAAVGPGGEDTK